MNYITKLIAVAKAVAVLWPLAIQFVEQVELLLPESGNGAAKLQMVKTWLKAAYESIEGLSTTFDDVWPTIERLIEALVASLNSLGLFKKGS